MEWISDPQIWISLVTLTILEIVLGIDNIIFISILAGKLPAEQQGKARTLGLGIALVSRVALLGLIFLLTKAIAPIFPQPAAEVMANASFPANVFYWFQGIVHHEFSWKDVVLLAGGLFLLWKSVHEIHGNLEGAAHPTGTKGAATMGSVIAQIVVIDLVFSLDSVITAVGIAKEIGVMVAAVVLAMVVMLLAAGTISDFVNRHPTVKMLALSFLLLVGVLLVADGFGQHINKNYVYFAMAFSFGVEMLNIRARNKHVKPVELLKTPQLPAA